MQISIFEGVYIFLVLYFIWTACVYSFKKNIRYRQGFKKLKINYFHLFFPFPIILTIAFINIIFLILICMYYISVIILLPLFYLVVFLTLFFIIFAFISGTLKLSIASLLYLSFLTFLLMYAHSKLFKKIYLISLDFINSIFNLEFINNKTIFFRNYIKNKNYLSLQVYFIYGLIYLAVNTIKFTEGMFDKVYTFTSDIIDKTPFLIDSKKELLDILTVILTTEYLLEALITFAIFDLIFKEIKHHDSNKNDCHEA